MRAICLGTETLLFGAIETVLRVVVFEKNGSTQKCTTTQKGAFWNIFQVFELSTENLRAICLGTLTLQFGAIETVLRWLVLEKIGITLKCTTTQKEHFGLFAKSLSFPHKICVRYV